jgi:hypothetical protein
MEIAPRSRRHIDKTQDMGWDHLLKYYNVKLAMYLTLRNGVALKVNSMCAI